MNFKKFIFKKRFLIIGLLLIATPGIILAVQDFLSYSVTAGASAFPVWPRQSDNVSVSNTALCVNNTSANNYFIGNKTQNEILSFFNNMPTGVSYNTSCCLDGVCNGAETCSSCSDDCGSCSSPCWGTFTDTRNSQVYPVFQSGSQCWMAKNLNYGTMVNSTNGGILQQGNYASGAQKWCYSFNESNCTVYGGLYQWHMAMGLPQICDGQQTCTVTIPIVNQGICPTGWHIPTDTEWSSLYDSLGGLAAAGGKLKETGTSHWTTPNTGADNYSGFTALPGGYIYGGTGGPYYLGTKAYFWAASQTAYSSNSKSLDLSYNAASAIVSNTSRQNGYSVRCVRDIPARMPTCGHSVTGIDSVTYGTVWGADGKCWLDRNLGATRVAQSSSDSASYGYYYQWGRGFDGHQNKTSAVTTTLSSGDTPGHGNFIKAAADGSSNWDWRRTANDNLWKGVNGINNPCPAGFRLPTQTELQTLFTTSGITNAATAYSSSLKLTAPGQRDATYGISGTSGTSGYYWSSDVFGIYGYDFAFGQSSTLTGGLPKEMGLSVRCISSGIPTVTLTYTAGANGSVSGILNQTINVSTSGSPVTALANTGFHFSSWSDGSTSNPRTDTNVSQDKSVVANFVANICGDALCSNGETCSSCSTDCGVCPYCGDGYCNGDESCGNWDDPVQDSAHYSACYSDCSYCSCYSDNDCIAGGGYCSGYTDPSCYGYYLEQYDQNWYNCAGAFNDEQSCLSSGCSWDAGSSGSCI